MWSLPPTALLNALYWPPTLSNKVSLTSMILLILALAGAPQPLSPPGDRALRASESITRFERSKHKIDFFTLANQYESEQNLAMCGPATAVIVLNALRAGNDTIVRPKDASLYPRSFPQPTEGPRTSVPRATRRGIL